MARKYRSEARDVEGFIERDDEEVFRESSRLGTSPEQATVRIEDSVAGPGRYTCYIDIGTQEIHLHPSEFADVDIPESCISLQ